MDVFFRNEPNKTLSKLNGFEDKNYIIFCWRSKLNSNYMVILKEINVFSINEANKTLSKLDGSYNKSNTIFCWRTKRNSKQTGWFL